MYFKYYFENNFYMVTRELPMETYTIFNYCQNAVKEKQQQKSSDFQSQIVKLSNITLSKLFS